MNDQHPAIVIGEPIPEVEPRVDPERIRMMRLANRWFGWFIVMVLFMAGASSLMRLGFVGRLVLLGVGFVLWMFFVVYQRVFGDLAKNRRTQNRFSSLDDLEGKWAVPLRVHVQYYGLIFGLIVSMQFLMLSEVNWTGLGLNLGMYTAGIGVVLLVLGFRGREPGQISCRKCWYPLVGLTLPCMCPECGISILDETRTTDRPGVRTPWLKVVGAGMLIIGSAITYGSVAKPLAMYRMMPARTLQNLATSDRRAFENLTANPMTPDQTSGFIDRLVDAYEADDLGYQQGVWLWDQMVVGTLTKDQMDRMLAFIPEIEIDAVASARAGESVEISLRSADPDPSNSRFRPYYFFGGFEIEGDEERHAQSSHYKEWKYLYQDLFRSEFSKENPKNRPFHTVTLDRDQAINITAHVVVVIGDPRSLVRFDWDEEQKPVFNFQPVWYRVIEIEHTIEVIED